MSFPVDVKVGLYRLAMVVAALTLSACAGTPHSAGHEEARTPEERGELFFPSQDAVKDVEATLQRAAAGHKRALVILGGNWCHDSRALAARIHQPPLHDLVQREYETVFVDVGYLDQGREVAQALGIPIYYATPTVLIVDPDTSELLNRADRHQWGAAAGISMDESMDYFERMANLSASTAAPVPTDELARLYAEIEEFEQRMALKVARGYERVGPMLRAYKEGGQVPASFEQDWEEVSRFRNGIPGVIEELRTQAEDRYAEGEKDIELDFPVLRPYSWEP